MKNQVYCDDNNCYAIMLKTVEILSEIEQDLRYSVQPRIVLETALIKIIHEATIESRLEVIEEKIKNFPS